MTAPNSIEKLDFEFQLDLPETVSIKVEDGQSVELGELLAEVDQVTCHQVELTEVFPLGYGIEALGRLAVKVGQKVAKDELLAIWNKGMAKKEFRSPVAGKVIGFTEMGVLKIETGQHEEILAPFAGQIKENGKKRLSIMFPAVKIETDWGQGKEFVGPLVLADSQGENFFNVEKSILGAIVVCAQPVSQAALFKMHSLGAGGVIVIDSPKKTEEVLEKIKPQMGDVFGVVAIDADDEDKLAFLKEADGRQALLRSQERELVVAS